MWYEAYLIKQAMPKQAANRMGRGLPELMSLPGKLWRGGTKLLGGAAQSGAGKLKKALKTTELVGGYHIPLDEAVRAKELFKRKPEQFAKLMQGKGFKPE